jgi:hypothetical protein
VRIFLSGLLLWSATVLITFVTRNANLVPTIILLGSFLVPVAFVTYAFGHADRVVTAQRIFTAFVYGGVLGILGGTLFAVAARDGGLRLSRGVLGSYVLVALLHGLWDASQGIAVWLTLLLTGTPVQWLLIQLGRAPEVTPAQMHLFTILSWGLLALDALLGVLVLRGRWRRATASDRLSPPTPLPLGHRGRWTGRN